MKKQLPVRLLALALLAASFVSCKDRQMRHLLNRLDQVISNRAIYVDAFEMRTDLLRDSLSSASSDTTRWDYAHRLYQHFFHYNLDSAARYVALQQEIAGRGRVNDCRVFRTELANINVLAKRYDTQVALDLYLRLDSNRCGSPLTRKEYLYCGIDLCKYLQQDPGSSSEKDLYKRKAAHLRNEYLRIDSTGITARKILSNKLRSEGRYDQALQTLLPCWEWEMDVYDRALTAYHIALLYKYKGDREAMKRWFVESAIRDFQVPTRDYLSLYYLALALYEDHQLARATKYIEITLSDNISTSFKARIKASGNAQLAINESLRYIEESKRFWLQLSSLVFALLFIVVLLLFRKNLRHTRQIVGYQHELQTANLNLSQLNKRLCEVNKIKNNYLFRYMELATYYLSRAEVMKHEFRKTAKTEGVDALIALLRFSNDSQNEFKKFYRIFDETFLGVFPGFVEQVNQLLCEKARFRIKDNTLPTELRILAVMRLGIVESGKIAKFLNCSPITVYTYRTKLRNAACCPKEDFEQRIMAIHV